MMRFISINILFNSFDWHRFTKSGALLMARLYT